MKNLKLTKSIALLLFILGIFVLTGCHQNKLPVDDEPDTPPTGEVDCEKNPDHEDCKDDSDDSDDKEEYPFSYGFTLYRLKDPDTNEHIDAYSVGNYKGEDTVVKIPNVYKDKEGKEFPIIRIKDNAFENNTKITKVIIPDSIEELGNNIFSRCSSLEEVVFDGISKITKIPTNTFYKCTSLKDITIPTTVKIIEDYAFYQCSSIAELRVPISVVLIGRSAFGAMTSLSKLSVPFIGGGRADSLEAKVLGYVFDTAYTEFTVQLSQKVSETSTKTYFIPSSLKTIEILSGSSKSLGYGALSGVTSIETIIIPSTIEKFDDDVFAGATGINKIIYAGSKNDWLEIIGLYDTGNKEVLDEVEIIYDYAG